jgi:uncharacterized protein
MNFSIHSPGLCNTPQLQIVLQAIIKTTSPEHIFLLGALYNRQQFHSIFTDAPASFQQVMHYDLLVLLSPADKRNIDELQDIIENRCKPHTPVTVIILNVQQFNHQLTTAHPFACNVHQHGLHVYNAQRTPLENANPPGIATLQSQAKETFEKWHRLAQEFMTGAELYAMRKQFSMAAFMLHQVAERSYVELIQVMTGYRPGTHNLDKLARYAKSFSTAIHLLFPRNTEKEEHLFRQLQKAYIHSRYKDDYAITEQEVQELLVRVKKLLQLAGEACEEKIGSMGGKKAKGAEVMCIGKAV